MSRGSPSFISLLHLPLTATVLLNIFTKKSLLLSSQACGAHLISLSLSLSSIRLSNIYLRIIVPCPSLPSNSVIVISLSQDMHVSLSSISDVLNQAPGCCFFFVFFFNLDYSHRSLSDFLLLTNFQIVSKFFLSYMSSVKGKKD